MSTWSGWTCGACGQWVSAGTYHSCGGLQPTTDATIAMGLGRIEALLEQILARLTAIEAKQ